MTTEAEHRRYWVIDAILSSPSRGEHHLPRFGVDASDPDHAIRCVERIVLCDRGDSPRSLSGTLRREDAWSEARAFSVERQLTLSDPLGIWVRIARPRPSPRVLRDPAERESALDFEVELCVGGRIFEGSVTLYDPYPRKTDGRRSGRWVPCRSGIYGGELGWVNGQLASGIAHARSIMAEDVAGAIGKLIDALSGASWPSRGGISEWDPTYGELLLEV